MPDRELYTLQRIDEITRRVDKLQSVQTERANQSAEWRSKMAGDIATLTSEVKGFNEWKNHLSNRFRQMTYGAGILGLTWASSASSENVDRLTGMLKALKSFMTALSGL